MKISAITMLACAIASVFAVPQLPADSQLTSRDSPLSLFNSHEKRKGGGGGRSGGGGSGGKGGGSYSYSSSSNVGGRTREGSGTPKQYGNYYTGGAQVPYKAGTASPSRGIAPYVLPIAAVGFFPGIWLHSVWAYPYPYGYHWYSNGRNHTSNVTCLCQDYGVCGCDPTDNSTFLSQVLSNGTGGEPVNSTNARTIDWGNGTIASYINGTLDNGTTADGGTDPSNDSEVSPAVRLAINYLGYWAMVATVVISLVFL